MTGIAIMAILGVVALGGIALVCIVLLTLIGGRQRRAHAHDAETTRLVQELYKGLERMEQRVEALETLLVDREPRRDRGQERDQRRADALAD